VRERLLALKEVLIKYGDVIGYPLFYVLCLAVFIPFTFPYDKVKERVVSSFNADQRANGGQQELQIESLSGYWLTGVRMTGVTLLSAPSEPGKPPTRLGIESATVRYSVLPALIGHSDLGFDAEAFDGEVSGSFEVHGKDKSLDATVEAIDIGKVAPLIDVLGVPLEGKLGGSVHMVLPEGRVSRATGQVLLELKGTSVGDGKAKIKGALALPKLEVGTIAITADAKDGVLKLMKFGAGGKDLELQGDGRVTLREQVAESLWDLQVRFRINDPYRAKNDITKSLFGGPGSSGPPLFELADPKISQSKRADGFYAWSVRGALARLDFQPAAR
jgi:type II secretion system protein N